MIRLIIGLSMVLIFISTNIAKAEKQCLTEALSVTGKPSAIGELARANAFFTWKAVAKDKHGADYNAWSQATERKLLCVDLMSGENTGKWECTRTARPCKKQKIFAATPVKCKVELTTAYGSRQRSKARAKAEAISGWSLAIQRSFGDEWTNWAKARQKSTSCHKKNSTQYQCVASGNACPSE